MSSYLESIGSALRRLAARLRGLEPPVDRDDVEKAVGRGAEPRITRGESTVAARRAIEEANRRRNQDADDPPS